ncbi:DinB family protein [Mucilaginibacter sp. AW1-3]
MTNSERLYNQLSTALYGHAWYGSPIYNVIDGLSFDSAYQKLPGASNSIAAILMHMLAWTEEVISRVQGNVASIPAAGDWPEVGEPSEQNLQQLINNFKLVNVELLQLISDFPEDKWNTPTNDPRGIYTGYEASYEAMVTGLIQHHVYHTGQIVLLNKLSNGQ